MKNRTLFKVGIGGTAVAALCCLTPVLVVTLGAIGLSSVVGVLDYVLLPTLALFSLMTGYALWKHHQRN